MFKLLVLAGSVLAFAAAPAMAGGHMKMEPPPGIFIPIPPDVELPPPEDGPEKLVEFAMMFLDKDGDGVISHEADGSADGWHAPRRRRHASRW